MNPFLTRIVFGSLALILAFAAVFTWVDAGPGWPNLPPGFGRRLDLAAGFAFCAGAALLALRSRESRNREM